MNKYDKLLTKLKNKSVMNIFEIIKNIDRVTRIFLVKLALDIDINLAKRIEEANQIINNIIANGFKNSVIKGNYLDYLTKLSLTDKIFLKVDLNLNKEYLSIKELNYLQILNQTIEEELKKLHEESKLIKK